MESDLEKFKKFKDEYLYLLEISPQGDEHRALFESERVPLVELGEHIISLKNKITKLKEELSSSGVDIKSFLEND